MHERYVGRVQRQARRATDAVARAARLPQPSGRRHRSRRAARSGRASARARRRATKSRISAWTTEMMSIGIWLTELHPRRAGAQRPEQQRGRDHAERVARAEQRHGDAVEAVADAEAGRVVVVERPAPRSRRPGRPARPRAPSSARSSGRRRCRVAGGARVGADRADLEAEVLRKSSHQHADRQQQRQRRSPSGRGSVGEERRQAGRLAGSSASGRRR